VVRTDPASVKVSTSVQVSCEGTVRYQAPLAGDGGVGVQSIVTEQQIDAAMVGARGTVPDRAAVRDTIEMMSHFVASPGPCKVLYSGPVPGFVPGSRVQGLAKNELTVLAVARTTVHGNTAFFLTNGAGGVGPLSRVKLTDPHAIFALQTGVTLDMIPSASGAGGQDTSQTAELLLMVAPATATHLQALRDGKVIQSVTLNEGIGSITLPESEIVQLQARDKSGTVVGSGTSELADNIAEDEQHETPKQISKIENWS
jgi:hypothetical protein